MAIHSGIGQSEVYIKGTFASYLYPLLFRLAVPYFFVASGYFFGRKIYNCGVYNGFDNGGIIFADWHRNCSYSNR